MSAVLDTPAAQSRDQTSTAPIRPAPPPLDLQPCAPYHVVSDFFADAQVLRTGYESHFADPYQHGDQRQVWDYWHVPDSYTYLRTSPEKVLPRAALDAFYAGITSFARRSLGMDVVTWPHLSLYVEGCRQTLHNDSTNGAFGYVYSLTNWDSRLFTGGETLIFREEDYWASGRFRQAGAGSAFYEKVPSRFNQLLVFDDRLIHGVPDVHGTTDPREGRLVLHGHLKCTGITVEGALREQGAGALAELEALVAGAQDYVAGHEGELHGFLTTAVRVGLDGVVASVAPLVQRVLHPSGPVTELPFAAEFRRRLGELRFPALGATSHITVPLFFA